jgi:hypothetical protein
MMVLLAVSIFISCVIYSPVAAQTTGGGGAPVFEPASSQCLVPSNYTGVDPSTVDGYNACFRYIRRPNGTATIYSSDVPDHVVTADNPNSLCYVSRKFTLPKPVKTNNNTRIPQLGSIGIAVNGVQIYGALEGGGSNAVAGANGIVVPCYGHAQPEGIWHYHHPEFGCKVVDEKTLVGYALDGFPIYGPLKGSKDEVDKILDECNGRDFHDRTFGYRYHTRSRAQVDETLTTNDGPNNTDNWKYVLGCYRGQYTKTVEEVDNDVCPNAKSKRTPCLHPASTKGSG